MQPLEYSLALDNGEVLEICELDPECFPCLRSPGPVLSEFIERCSVAPRRAVEEAKAGYSRPLHGFLKAGAVGAMLKVRSPACADMKSCVIANPAACTLRNVSKGLGQFPECWTAGSGDEAWLASTIAHAWKRGAHVILLRTLTT